MAPFRLVSDGRSAGDQEKAIEAPVNGVKSVSAAPLSKPAAKARGQKGAVNSEYNRFIRTRRGGKAAKIQLFADALGNNCILSNNLI